MASEPRTMTVPILGHEYRIRTTESPEFVREVAAYVDETLRGLAARMTQGTPTQVAVLGALNIAEQLFRERRDGAGGTANGEIEARMQAILARLEEVAPEKAGRARKAALARAAGGGG